MSVKASWVKRKSTMSLLLDLGAAACGQVLKLSILPSNTPNM